MADILSLPKRVALALFAADLVGVVLAFNLAHWWRIGTFLGLRIDLALPMAIVLLALYVLDCYSVDAQVSGMRAAPRTLVAVMLGAIATGAVVYAAGLWGGGNATFGRGVLPVAYLFFAIWAALWRLHAARYQRAKASTARWLILGAGEKAARLQQDFLKTNVAAEISFLADASEDNAGLDPVVGDIQEVETVLTGDWSGVIAATVPPLADNTIQLLMKAKFCGVRVYEFSDFYEQLWFKVPVLHTQKGWLLFSQGFDLLHSPLALRLKRLLDLVVSAALFVVCFPLMLLIALAIRLDSRGPAIFRQTRTGLNGREFEILKFRSMEDDAERDGPQWADSADPRVTRVGRVIRALRADELPQLINVFKGEMSFIGPRPERPVFNQMLEKQIPFYDLRQLVRPGITGWAQVLYPYGASIDDALEKLQYDLYYIKNYSLLLDLAILLKTLRVVLLGRGR